MSECEQPNVDRSAMLGPRLNGMASRRAERANWRTFVGLSFSATNRIVTTLSCAGRCADRPMRVVGSPIGGLVSCSPEKAFGARVAGYRLELTKRSSWCGVAESSERALRV